MGQHPLGDVNDEPFQGQQGTFSGNHSPSLFPNPLLLSGGGADAIGELEGSSMLQSGLHLVPHGFPILRMDRLCVGDLPAPDQIRGGVTGQFEATLADKLHRPVPIVLAAIGHARQVAHQR